jgi:hypothetical protein
MLNMAAEAADRARIHIVYVIANIRLDIIYEIYFLDKPSFEKVLDFVMWLLIVLKRSAA